MIEHQRPAVGSSIIILAVVVADDVLDRGLVEELRRSGSMDATLRYARICR